MNGIIVGVGAHCQVVWVCFTSMCLLTMFQLPYPVCSGDRDTYIRDKRGECIPIFPPNPAIPPPFSKAKEWMRKKKVPPEKPIPTHAKIQNQEHTAHHIHTYRQTKPPAHQKQTPEPSESGQLNHGVMHRIFFFLILPQFPCTYRYCESMTHRTDLLSRNSVVSSRALPMHAL